MPDKLYIYDQGSGLSQTRQVAFSLPNDTDEISNITIFWESLRPWQGGGREQPSEIRIKIISDASDDYIIALRDLINNYLRICMTGYFVTFVNRDGSFDEEFLELEWLVEDQNGEVSESFLGRFISGRVINGEVINGKIQVKKPNITHTPIILLHELFHAKELEHRGGGDQNIMGDDFLTINYKTSPMEVVRMHSMNVGITLSDSILPPTPCILTV